MKTLTMKVPDSLYTEFMKAGIAMNVDSVEEVFKMFVKLGLLAVRFENSDTAGLYFRDEDGEECKISLIQGVRG